MLPAPSYSILFSTPLSPLFVLLSLLPALLFYAPLSAEAATRAVHTFYIGKLLLLAELFVFFFCSFQFVFHHPLHLSPSRSAPF